MTEFGQTSIPFDSLQGVINIYLKFLECLPHIPCQAARWTECSIQSCLVWLALCLICPCNMLVFVCVVYMECAGKDTLVNLKCAGLYGLIPTRITRGTQLNISSWIKTHYIVCTLSNNCPTENTLDPWLPTVPCKNWSDCTNVLADQSHCWAHMQYLQEIMYIMYPSS